MPATDTPDFDALVVEWKKLLAPHMPPARTDELAQKIRTTLNAMIVEWRSLPDQIVIQDSMPLIKYSDKQLPNLLTATELEVLMGLAQKATPGKRELLVIDEHNQNAAPQFSLRTEHNLPLGRADAELAQALNPGVVMGLLYQIHQLEVARDKLAKIATGLSKNDPAQQTLILQLWKTGTP